MYRWILTGVQVWLQANRLQLNISKSVLMLIGSWQKLQSHSVFFLTWQNHINCILKSVRSKFYKLCRLKPLPTSLLLLFTVDYILPIFDYCDSVWSPSTAILSKSLESVHSHFVNSLSHTDTFVKPTLAEQRRFYTSVAFFKSINKAYMLIR